MTRLGENVFQFPKKFDLRVALILVSIPFIINALGDMMGVFDIEESLLTGLFISCILSIIIGFRLFKIYKNNRKNGGVILDMDKGIISIYKWTWSTKAPKKDEDIIINEIIGINRDVDVETTTKYNNNQWHTTESRSYNIVLQGKFGSRRFSLANQDDWNLFMTLLYGDNSDE